jgi:two-component system, NtrC family, sensor kinase
MHGIGNCTKLDHQIVATTLCFSFIPLFAFGLSMNALFSVSITARVIDGISTFAENRWNAIDLFPEKRIAQLHTLAYMHSIHQLQDAEGYLGSLLNLIQAQGRAFIDLGVTDRAGNPVGYVGFRALHGLNYAFELWFREAVEQGIHVSSFLLGCRKTPHFIIAVVRREGDGSRVLRATIDADIFDALVKTARVGTGEDTSC